MTTTEIVDLTEINRLCRICLTKSTASMIPLSAPLNKGISPSILEALEKVMSVKLLMSKKYPITICPMCKGLLKISYDLNNVFSNSQTVLMEYFTDILYESKIDDDKKNAPVELIFGNNRYSLSDVVIVEDEKEEQNNYQGFLSNLGTTVSAVFVNNSDKKSKKSSDILDKYYNTIEPFKTEEIKKETVVEVSLDELQGCNVKDLFPDQQFFNFLPENPEIEPVNNMEPLEDVNKENLTLRKIYKCDGCDVLCANRTRLKLHLTRHHLAQIPYLCDTCSAVSFHENNVPNSDIISCEDCGSINTKRKVKKKSQMGKILRQYLCQICGNISNSATSARYHRNKHFNVQYQCTMCDKKYLSKATLQWHLNRHNNVKNLLCSFCGKKFNYQSALVYHLRMHTNEKKYVCVICDKEFLMHQSLKRHIRTHTGERPYPCIFCKKAFFSPEEKKKHEMIHTGQRPFKCKYCNKGFTSSFNRNLHHMTHSGDHECFYCSKTFKELEFLKLHLKDKHKDVIVEFS